MLIYDPENAVVAFDRTNWVLEYEPCPRAEIEAFLRERGLLERQPDEDEDEDEDEDDEEKEEEYEDWATVLYAEYCLAEDGSVLLISEDDDEKNLYAVGATADALRKILRSSMMTRVERLQKFLAVAQPYR